MCVLIARWECNSLTPGVSSAQVRNRAPMGTEQRPRAMDAESLGVGTPVRPHGPEYQAMYCRSAWYALRAELKLASATAPMPSPDTLRAVDGSTHRTGATMGTVVDDQ